MRVLKHQKTKLISYAVASCFPYEGRNPQRLGIIFQYTFLVYHFPAPYLFFSNWLVSLGSRYISDILGCLLSWHMHSYTFYLCINVSKLHIFTHILFQNTHAKTEICRNTQACTYIYVCIRRSNGNPIGKCVGYCYNICHLYKRNRNEMGIKFAYSLKHRGSCMWRVDGHIWQEESVRINSGKIPLRR